MCFHIVQLWPLGPTLSFSKCVGSEGSAKAVASPNTNVYLQYFQSPGWHHWSPSHKVVLCSWDPKRAHPSAFYGAFPARRHTGFPGQGRNGGTRKGAVALPFQVGGHLRRLHLGEDSDGGRRPWQGQWQLRCSAVGLWACVPALPSPPLLLPACK